VLEDQSIASLRKLVDEHAVRRTVLLLAEAFGELVDDLRLTSN